MTDDVDARGLPDTCPTCGALPCDWAAGAETQIISSGWRTIDSAPKDGSKILGYCPDRGIRETCMGRYQDGSIGYARWAKGDGPRNHGWVWLEEVHNSAHSWKPTHWMPLPSLPTQDEAELL